MTSYAVNENLNYIVYLVVVIELEQNLAACCFLASGLELRPTSIVLSSIYS